ncbi:MmgE/PrpD family protein [Paraburkholderia caffeinilytica]|uniref:MmgE/PrpD family protein n=1 Tax=Paraburkholderia caffeinilytica TaxID=1761016 RepID=UPI0038BB4773
MDELTAWKNAAREHRGITMALAEFVAGLRPEAIPEHTQQIVKQAFVDSIGCGLHGLTTPWGRIVTEFAAELGGRPEAALWGAHTKVAAANAVLAAGNAIHGFDFDDHSRAKIHPGAVVVPVALALAEREQVSGDMLLTALAAGYETMNRVSLACNPARARMRGWHLTGTTGTFGAAAAASVILGFDAALTASAFGLAGTQSAGVWAFTADAAMSKRLHPGRAAQSGVIAALLAQRGFAGPRYILEAEDGGFLFTMSGESRPGEITRGLGDEWRTDGVCFKPHACCGSNHACVDAALTLLAEYRVSAADVERVIAGVPAVVQTQTGFEYRADSVLNAQMSLRYNLAVAMLDSEALLEQFTPARIGEKQVFDLAQRVEIEVDPELDAAYPEIYGGRVSLVMRDGRRLTRRVDYSMGMPENPMSHDHIERKFLSLAGHAVGDAQANVLLPATLEIFAQHSVTSLTTLLREVDILDTHDETGNTERPATTAPETRQPAGETLENRRAG